LPLVVVAVACSDSPKPSGQSPAVNPQTSDAIDGGSTGDRNVGDFTTLAPARDVCATLDYGHQRSNADYFLRFDNDSAALEYSRGFLASNGINADAEIARDSRLIRLVNRVFDGFRKVFPLETEGMDRPPRVLVVDQEGLNAFAGYDERRDVDKAPWLFWVHRATVNSSRPDAELEGLYAHELAHLILRNLLPETRAKIRTHYRVPGGAEHGVIGAVTPDDPVVRARAEELRTIDALVGREAAFGRLPLSAFEDNEYQSLLLTLAKQRNISSDAKACDAADEGIRRARAFYKAVVSVHDLTFEISPREAAGLADLEDSTVTMLRRCYANVKKSIFELKLEDRSVRVLVNGTPASLQTILDPTTREHKLAYGALMSNSVEQEVDTNTDRPTIERLLDIVGTLHRRADTLTQDTSLPIDELRVFDLEEDADDAAVRVLRAIGDDPRGAARLFVGQMPDPDACLSEIESGRVPRYGRFIDSHNATCWRAFHTMELAKALESCPAVPAQNSKYSRFTYTAEISPADPSPTQLLQRRFNGR